mgnify:CR=1 FL=1
MIRFLTNNSGQTRDFYVEKLCRMGFEAQPLEVYSSAMGATRWLKENGVQRVFYVGEPGLRATLAESVDVVKPAVRPRATSACASRKMRLKIRSPSTRAPGITATA